MGHSPSGTVVQVRSVTHVNLTCISNTGSILSDVQPDKSLWVRIPCIKRDRPAHSRVARRYLQTFLIGVVALGVVCESQSQMLSSERAYRLTVRCRLPPDLFSGVQGRVTNQVRGHVTRACDSRSGCALGWGRGEPVSSLSAANVVWLVFGAPRTGTVHHLEGYGQRKSGDRTEHLGRGRDRVKSLFRISSHTQLNDICPGVCTRRSYSQCKHRCQFRRTPTR